MVLVIGPVAPPYVGPAVGIEMIRAAFERAGARVLHVNTQDRRSVFNTGVLDLRNVRLALLHAARTAMLIARERPDLVYVPISQVRWGYVRDAVLMTILRLTRRPFVAHTNGARFQDFYGGAGRLEQLMIRRTLAWASRGIVLTPNLSHVFDGLVPGARVRILEYAIPDPYPLGDHALAEARRARAESAPRALRLLYLANDWASKGALTLIRSLSYPGLEDVELRLAGDPRQRDLDATRALADELGVAARVTILGSVSGETKEEQFEWADALVHPTDNDAQPIAIIEAMAAGLPVVTTPIGGIAHTVGPAGVLVPPRDPERLAGAIRSLVDDPDLRLRLGRASRAQFVAHYTPEPFQERFVALFGELVPLTPAAQR